MSDDFISERKKSAGFTELPAPPEAGAGRGFVNPPEEGAPPPQTPPPRAPSAATVKKKAPTTAENQAAFMHAMQDAKKRIMDMNFGDLEPRVGGYVAGALAGPTQFVQGVANVFDPIAVRERLAQLAARQAAAAAGIFEHGIPGFRAKDPNASGTENYGRKMPGGSQLPANLLAEAEDMSKGNPRGKGVWDIAARDANAMAKINALTGEGTYTLQGEGVPPAAPKPFQIMLPDGTNYTGSSSSAGALPVVEEASTLNKIKSALNTPLNYAKGVLAHPAVNAGLHAANAIGTGVQAVSDIYNQDWPGLAITGGQVVGSAIGGPEFAIPAGEAIRYLRAHPEKSEAIGDALQRGNQVWGQSRFGLD